MQISYLKTPAKILILEIAGNGQAGVRLEAGAVLQQPQEKCRGATKNGQRGQCEILFHIKTTLSDDQCGS